MLKPFKSIRINDIPIHFFDCTNTKARPDRVHDQLSIIKSDEEIHTLCSGWSCYNCPLYNNPLGLNCSDYDDYLYNQPRTILNHEHQHDTH